MRALTGVAVATAFLLAGACGGGGAPQPGRPAPAAPSFIVVMTDDLDKRSMRHLVGVRELMSDAGVRFSNAFVSYSLCCPSRSTFLRGQYAHNHGITSHRADLGEPRFRAVGRDASTIATWVDGAGYRTGYIGKYLNGYRGPYIPPGWDEWFALEGDVARNIVNDDGRLVAVQGNSTDAFAAEASAFIRRSAHATEPFFLVVGTRAPHRPPEVPRRYADRFASTPLPRPRAFDEADVSDKPAWVRAYPRISASEAARAERLHRDRLRSMLPVEDLLEQTIATLTETGRLASTYIVFTSDNGFHLGTHRLLPGDKKTPYDEDIRVPLLVRGPGVPAGSLRRQLVLNTDLAPTIADLAGIGVPRFVDGRSFAPLLRDAPPRAWRTAILTEGWRASGTAVPTNVGIRTRYWSYVEYSTGERELYDLRSDRAQLRSLSRDGNERAYRRLHDRLAALRTCAGAQCHAAEDAAAR